MPHFTDKLEAQVGSWVSCMAAKNPVIGDRLIVSDHPRAQRVGYYLAKNVVDSLLDDGWIRFEGDPSAGLWPKSYRKVGTLLGHKDRLDTMIGEDTNATLAIGWQHKGFILTGIIPENVGVKPVDGEDHYEVGMRVGKGVLLAALGVYNTESGTFKTLPPITQKGEVYLGNGAETAPNLMVL